MFEIRSTQRGQHPVPVDTSKYCVQPPDENDPIFENLVRCVTRHCKQFVELHGGDLRAYCIGASIDAREKLVQVHCIPEDTPYIIRDGLHTTAARTVIQQMVKRGCHGVVYVEAAESLDLYMYRIVPGVTVEDD